MRILIVEDDPGISNGLLTSLGLAGYAADVCDSLPYAWTASRVKPFDANEMLARIRAMLRRRAGRASPVLHCGDLLIDPAAHTVYVLQPKPPMTTRLSIHWTTDARPC